MAGREAVVEFLPENLPYIYIDIYSSMPLLLPQLLLRHRRRSIAQTRYDELDLVTSMNHRAKFLSRRLYRLTASMPTQSTHRHTHTHSRADRQQYLDHKVVGKIGQPNETRPTVVRRIGLH